MYIFKQAHVGGEVGAHQDGTFLFTEPQTCVGFWWALDDYTTSNGCLWAVPGSHKFGVKRRYRRRDGVENGTEFVPADIYLSVHYCANDSPHARHAYSIHIVDGREGMQYPPDNWLQRPADMPFRVIEGEI